MNVYEQAEALLRARLVTAAGCQSLLARAIHLAAAEAPLRFALRARLDELASLIARYTAGDGSYPTPIGRMTFLRSAAPSGLVHDVHEPSLCVVAQGSKRVMLGGDVYEYGRGCYLVATVDLPVCAEVLDATRERPYLCLKLGFDMNEVASMLLQVGETAIPNVAPERGLFFSRADTALLDAILRLARLLDTRDDIAALAPLAEREIIYRLLKSDEGRRLCHAVGANNHGRRIARAVAWLKGHFAEPLRIEALASHVGMSSSSLHEHFKAVTAMTPVQYQKQLRLQEARRLLMTEGIDAGTAGHRVGYESPSQFSREYRRMFGAPPSRDATRTREPSLAQGGRRFR
mgnify:CR=1 FL=1